jgi:hypothetical protein
VKHTACNVKPQDVRRDPPAAARRAGGSLALTEGGGGWTADAAGPGGSAGDYTPSAEYQVPRDAHRSHRVRHGGAVLRIRSLCRFRNRCAEYFRFHSVYKMHIRRG